MTTSHDSIEMQGVRTHNLRSINLKIPLGQLTVVTGVSGSGKSSLVFDTLYAESYRRYVESLSSYARQYLQQMPKPELDGIQNLPPAIAVKQAKSGLTQRSTVGTMTELNDVLRILFGQMAQIRCCGQLVEKASSQKICQDAHERWPNQRILLLASMAAWAPLKAQDLKIQLEAQGFTRCYLNGEVQRIETIKAADLKRSLIVIDRLTLNANNNLRCLEAVELTLRLGRGEAILMGEDGIERRYYKQLYCPHCKQEFLEPAPVLFNYNHPLGACEACQGFGRVAVRARDKIIPNLDKSLLDSGVAPWNFGDHDAIYKLAKKSAEQRGMDPAKDFRKYSETDWEWLENGDAKGRFTGIKGYFSWLDTKKYKAHYRIHSARFHVYKLCETCDGLRLNPKILVYFLGGRNFNDVSHCTLQELQLWFGDLGAQDRLENAKKAEGSQEAIQEGQLRLSYLLKMGLAYLNLARGARTLSGGEVQRINMARSLGSALTDTLFCLDEPSVGLHARDSFKLLQVIQELRNQGNTIVVVEHERTLIEGAEYLVEIGPGAGREGGELMFSGSPRDYLKPELRWETKPSLRSQDQFLVLSKVKTHNLQGVDAKFLLHGLNVVCGVSGSGKTSLVRHTLYPMLVAALGDDSLDSEKDAAMPLAESLGPLSALKTLHAVHFVSQEGIGRSSRSNIATYLGIFDEIRKLLAATPEAKAQDLKPGFFSFNIPGGRCEACKGLGYTIEDLSFLGDMPVTCIVCHGRQFSDQALNVLYRDRSLLDILKLTLTEAREFFFDKPKLKGVLDQVISMGLGYVSLGQSTSSFSGGEAQRLKLLKMMLDAVDQRPSCLIFDEPSNGLSDHDVQQFLRQLFRLRELGHTLIVVEHHLGLLKTADWLIEVGPEAAAAGGTIVYQGPPDGLRQIAESRTAPYLF